jgi:hypothetical protein
MMIPCAEQLHVIRMIGKIIGDKTQNVQNGSFCLCKITFYQSTSLHTPTRTEIITHVDTQMNFVVKL